MPAEDELNLEQIKKRVITGFVSLGLRQILLRATNFLTINIILLPILTPAQLGLFDLAGTFITFFSYFSDIGLAGSLIQKKESISREDIATTFTIQESLVGAVTVLILLISPVFGSFYHLDNDAIWLVRILGICFFLTSFKVIPSVLQERVLNFQPLVIVELVETLIFNGLLIYLVYNHFGIWAFADASLARTIIGVVLIYILAPVKVGVGIHRASAKELLSFGIPSQLNSILALLKDRLVPLIVANIVGLNGFGLISWAENTALAPLEAISGINRISFPVFSRLQEEKQALEKGVETTLFVTTLVVFPLIFGLMAVVPAIVAFVATKQWQSAVPLFYLYASSTIWAVISTVFTNTLNAIGKIKTTFKLMIMWTILTWILSPLLAWKFGIIGPALGYFLINFTSVITIVLVKKELEINLWRALSLPLICSITMAFIVFGFSNLVVRDKFGLGLAIIFGGFIYLLLIWFFGRNRIKADLRTLRNV